MLLATLVPLAPLEQHDLKERQEQQDHLEQRVLLDAQVPQVEEVLLAPLAPLEQQDLKEKAGTTRPSGAAGPTGRTGATGGQGVTGYTGATGAT